MRVRGRDAGAHGDALARGVAAAARFGFKYPPRDPAIAWEIVSRETVSALVALREQLEPLAVQTSIFLMYAVRTICADSTREVLPHALPHAAFPTLGPIADTRYPLG